MILYAERSGRRAAQVVADLALVAWVAGWVVLARGVHDVVLGLAVPGQKLESAGSGFRTRMSQAADTLDNLPLLDDRVASPFRSAADSGADLEASGRALVASVERLATFLGWTTALVPTALVLGIWLLWRGRFVRQANAAKALIDADADLDLFALRALSRQPMHRLARISSDPAGDWRRRDEPVIRALADLELRDAGLHPPR